MKLSSVLPLDLPHIHQAKIRFVDKGAWFGGYALDVR